MPLSPVYFPQLIVRGSAHISKASYCIWIKELNQLLMDLSFIADIQLYFCPPPQPCNILARTLTVQLCTAWQSTSFCWNWLPGYFSGCHFHTISPSSFVLYHLRYCRTLLFLPSPKQLWAEGIYLISVTLSRNSPTLEQGPLIHPHTFSAYSAFPKWVTRTSHSISGPDE